MAKGKRTALVARAVALVFALALVALAARLWIGSAPRETSASRPAGEAADDEGLDAVATERPLHGEHSAKDQEALRGLLRDDGREAP